MFSKDYWIALVNTMTLQKINVQPERLMFAFRSKERDYISILAERANYLLELIVHKKSTQRDKQEYYSIKWMMKEICAIDNDNLENVNEHTAISND